MTNGRAASSGPGSQLPGRAGRVGDGDHQPAAGHQNAGGLGHRLFHMVDVLQAHEGHGTVRGGVGHRQRGGITGSPRPAAPGTEAAAVTIAGEASIPRTR